MPGASDATLGLALTAAFFALTGVSLATWIRHGEPLHAFFAAASGQLGAVCLVFRLSDTAEVPDRLVAGLATVLILGSGWALLGLRNSVVPMTRRARTAVTVALGAAAVVGILVGFPIELEARFTPGQQAAAATVLGTWAFCVAEPIHRFWRSAARRPVVQRTRLRALSVGYGGMIAVLVVGVGGEWNESAVLLATLLLVGVQVVAFMPPRWLRRLWRDRELIQATADGAGLGRDNHELVEGSLRWAVRLVGADGGCLFDSERRLLFAYQVSAEEMSAFTPEVGTPTVPRTVTLCGRPARRVAVVPLPLESGRGTMLILAGPLTPRFGQDEIRLLAYLAESAAASVDRLNLDEVRGAFLNALSHELRTPLTSVVGLARTLRRPESSLLAAHQWDDLLGRLESNAIRLETLLVDLLDVDRLSRGILEPRRTPTAVDDLVRRVLENCLDLLLPRHLSVDLDPLTAEVDAPMVERIVENLVANAAKHTPPHATVWVRLIAHEGEFEICVADDGPGIPQHLRDAVFEPFRQGPTAPAHAPGSGIGLSLVARFAELHGGRAWVQPRSGGGVKFRVVLPAPINTPPRCPQTTAGSRSGGGGI